MLYDIKHNTNHDTIYKDRKDHDKQEYEHEHNHKYNHTNSIKMNMNMIWHMKYKEFFLIIFSLRFFLFISSNKDASDSRLDIYLIEIRI